MSSAEFHPKEVVFKEWSLVCDALGEGGQCLLLRKGGIAEGRGGFSFSHGSFWFFPTYFHDQADGVVPGAQRAIGAVPEKGDAVSLSLAAEVVGKSRIGDWGQVEALEGYHIWKPEVLKERFEYEEDRCLWCAVVRVYRADPVRTVTMGPRFGGCRSWVQLPEEAPGGYRFTPVVADAVFDESLEEIRGVIPDLQ